MSQIIVFVLFYNYLLQVKINLTLFIDPHQTRDKKDRNTSDRLVRLGENYLFKIAILFVMGISKNSLIR